MKKLILSLVMVVAVTAFCGLASAELPADVSPELVAKGKELFTTKTGLNVKIDCMLCHKGEKAIKKAEIEKAGDQLPEVINKYITTKSKGAALPVDSEEMKALIAYIRYEHSK